MCKIVFVVFALMVWINRAIPMREPFEEKSRESEKFTFHQNSISRQSFADFKIHSINWRPVKVNNHKNGRKRNNFIAVIAQKIRDRRFNRTESRTKPPSVTEPSTIITQSPSISTQFTTLAASPPPTTESLTSTSAAESSPSVAASQPMMAPFQSAMAATQYAAAPSQSAMAAVQSAPSVAPSQSALGMAAAQSATAPSQSAMAPSQSVMAAAHAQSTTTVSTTVSSPTQSEPSTIESTSSAIILSTEAPSTISSTTLSPRTESSTVQTIPSLSTTIQSTSSTTSQPSSTSSPSPAPPTPTSTPASVISEKPAVFPLIESLPSPPKPSLGENSPVPNQSIVASKPGEKDTQQKCEPKPDPCIASHAEILSAIHISNNRLSSIESDFSDFKYLVLEMKDEHADDHEQMLQVMYQLNDHLSNLFEAMNALNSLNKRKGTASNNNKTNTVNVKVEKPFKRTIRLDP